VYRCRLEPNSWYCPDTGEILAVAYRRPFLPYSFSADGRRLIRLVEPTLSSDMAFLFGAFVGIFATAALLYAAGFLLIRGKNMFLFAVGAWLFAIGLVGPVYYGLSKILLGRKCTRRKPELTSGALPPLPYRLGWVMAADGAGILSGAVVVIAVMAFLIASRTASYLY
jgi:hypothetical protein